MNRVSRTLYLLVAALVAAGCGRAVGDVTGSTDTSATITRSWPASEVRHLSVSEVAGSIIIEAVPTDEVSLVAKARGDLDPQKGEENQGLFVTTLEGGELRIGRSERRRRGGGLPFIFSIGRKSNRIDYTLRVPPSTSVEVDTVNGRIRTRGVGGELQATTVNGAIDVEVSGANELTARTVNGKVRATFRDSFSGARFRSVNGGVAATLPASASFRVDLSQVNGGFEASFPLSIHSNAASRRVSGEVNGGEHPLKIVTVNGHVALDRASR